MKNKYKFISGILMVVLAVAIVAAVSYPEPFNANVDAGNYNLSNANYISANYFNGTLTGEVIGSMNWTLLKNYPVACPAGSAITQLNDSVTCSDLWVNSAGDTMTGPLIINDASNYSLNVSNALFVNGSSGNVGIGTTSPQARLDLGAVSGDGEKWLRMTTSDGVNYTFEQETGGGTADFQFKVNGNYAFVVLDNANGRFYNDLTIDDLLTVGNGAHISGNVGIGTTSPLGKLHVNSSTNIPFIINGTNGYVGIGTTGPLTLLHLESATTSDITMKNTGNDNVILWMDSNVTNTDNYVATFAGKWDGTSVGHVAIESGDDTTNKDEGFLSFWTRGTGDAGAVERMRIEQDGKIGINTTTPQNTLNIVGDLNVTGTSYLGNIIITAENITVDNLKPLTGGLIAVEGNMTIYDKITFRLGEIIDNIVDGWVRIDGSLNVTGSATVTGNITGENVHLPAYVFSHTNRTIAVPGVGNWTNVTFDEEDDSLRVDVSHTYNDATNTTFTIGTAGVYMITYTMAFADSAASPDAHVVTRVVQNGAEISGSLLELDTDKQNADTIISHSNILVSLSANDEIKFQFTSDDTSVSLSSHATYGDHRDSCVITIRRVA